MRIAHFLVGRCNPDSSNGVDKAVYYLSRAQAAAGADVALFCVTAKAAIPIPNVPVMAYSPARLGLSIPRPLWRDLLSWRPDIVHLHSVYTPVNAAFARKLARASVPYVVTPHGGLSPFVTRRRWLLKAPYGRLVERRMLNRAAFVHAVADAGDIRRFGVRVPIVTAPNGMDLSPVPRRLDPGLLVRRWPELRGRRIFLFLGRLDPRHKGLDLLLAALSSAGPRDVSLVLVGPDWRGGRRMLEDRAVKLGVQKQTIFAGPSHGEEKFSLLAGADVFVHPSRWEGLSFAVLEAAAAGKPCLLTHAADPNGMVATHGAGVVVEASVAELARGIRRLRACSDSDLRTMGERARRMVATEFEWRGTAAALIQAYERHRKAS